MDKKEEVEKKEKEVSGPKTNSLMDVHWATLGQSHLHTWTSRTYNDHPVK